MRQAAFIERAAARPSRWATRERRGGGRGRAPGSGVTSARTPLAPFLRGMQRRSEDARADADRAYGEMVHRLSNAWRR